MEKLAKAWSVRRAGKGVRKIALTVGVLTGLKLRVELTLSGAIDIISI